MSLVTCLAFAVYMESKSEPIKGQEAVAEVVMNRTTHPQYPDNPCSVVKQKGQFSWYSSRTNITKEPINADKEQWQTAKRIAEKTLVRKTNHTNGSLFFNTVNLGVRYKTKNKACRIGSHLFY